MIDKEGRVATHKLGVIGDKEICTNCGLYKQYWGCYKCPTHVRPESPKKVGRPRVIIDTEEVCRVAKTGMGIKQVAKLFRISRPTLYKILKGTYNKSL
jgi:DNA invertase Pin-like site-specific DNA recombinase